MRTVTTAAAMCVALAGTILLYAAANQEPKPMTEKQFMVNSIGVVQNEKGRATLVLNEDIQPALRGLDGFSHVWVFWWFDRNDTPQKRAVLQVHPRGNKDNPLTGVFACRSPARPNLIGLTLCKVLSVKDNVVEVEKIDAFSNTPILDLKPYIPGYDSAEASVPNWLKSGGKSKSADLSTWERARDLVLLKAKAKEYEYIIDHLLSQKLKDAALEKYGADGWRKAIQKHQLENLSFYFGWLTNGRIETSGDQVLLFGQHGCYAAFIKVRERYLLLDVGQRISSM